MTANPTDTSGKYVSSLDVDNGVLIMMFGHEANAAIDGLTLTVTPYETPELGVVWRCGTAAGTARALARSAPRGGGNAAAYLAPTVPDRYLPASCRP